MQPRL